MKSLRALLLGLAAGVTPLLLVGVAIHFAIGIDQALEAIQAGQLGYLSVAAFVLAVCALSGTKVFAAVSVIQTAARYGEAQSE